MSIKLIYIYTHHRISRVLKAFLQRIPYLALFTGLPHDMLPYRVHQQINIHSITHVKAKCPFVQAQGFPVQYDQELVAEFLRQGPFRLGLQAQISCTVRPKTDG
jgi:hypothetical protein